MTTQERIAAGVPTGGRFAAARHTESEISLAPSPSNAPGTPPAQAAFPDDWRCLQDPAVWRSQGFSYPEAVAWTKRGFVVSDANSWANESFTVEDADRWRAADLSPKQAASWSFHEIEVETAKDFRGHGFLDADVANPWVRKSFTAEQAQQWVGQEYRRAFEAEQWRDRGFDPEEAGQFRSTHLSPSSAAKWRDAGFSAVDAEGWSDLGFPDAKVWAPTHLPEDAEDWIRSETVSGPAEAMEWEGAKIEPRDVDDWRKAGCPTAFDAQPWRERSFSAAETCMWRAQRFEPEQAERYRGQGLDPRRAYDVDRNLQPVG